MQRRVQGARKVGARREGAGNGEDEGGPGREQGRREQEHERGGNSVRKGARAREREHEGGREHKRQQEREQGAYERESVGVQGAQKKAHRTSHQERVRGSQQG